MLDADQSRSAADRYRARAALPYCREGAVQVTLPHQHLYSFHISTGAWHGLVPDRRTRRGPVSRGATLFDESVPFANPHPPTTLLRRQHTCVPPIQSSYDQPPSEATHPTIQLLNTVDGMVLFDGGGHHSNKLELFN